MAGMNKIGRQLMALVIVAFSVFTIGISGLAGYQSYHDMEDMALQRVTAAAKLFGSELEAQVARTHRPLSDIVATDAMRKQLHASAARIGTELAIVDAERVWASSIAQHRYRQQQPVGTHSLKVNQRPYLFAAVTLNLAYDGAHQFQVMALSTRAGISQRTTRLMVRLIFISALIVLLTSLAMYLLVRIKLRDPLHALLHGVQEIQQGKQDVRVNIHSQNEFTTLGEAFNKMVRDIQYTALELHQANDTLEQKVEARTQELANAQQQLIMAEKMASLGQLVAGIAHEINTPLGNSITALSFIHDSQKKVKKLFDSKALTSSDFGQFLQDSDESMSLMETNLRKTSELVKTFKNVAVNQSLEELVEFSVGEHVQEVMLTLRPQLKKTQIEVSFDIDDQLVITSYPSAYYHIFSNMIMNSLKHAFVDNKGHIQLHIHVAGDRLMVVYEDDGLGIEPEVLKRIFDPFYTTKRGEGGTGLGLYMTYNIVTQQLDGEIEAHSTLGVGTRFNLCLPLLIKDSPEHHKNFSV